MDWYSGKQKLYIVNEHKELLTLAGKRNPCKWLSLDWQTKSELT